MYEQKVDAPLLTEEYRFKTDDGDNTGIINENKDNKRYKKLPNGDLVDTETGQTYKQTTL